MPAAPTVRRLGPSEVYYQVLDRLWPMNALCLVELDADPAAVRAAWARAVELVPLLGARVRPGADRGGEVEFGGPGLPEPWATFPDERAALRAEQSTPLDLARSVARCSLVEGEHTTTAVVCLHHALIDGRGITQVALLLADLVAGREPADHPLYAATSSLEDVLAATTDARQRRREQLALAREVRAEDAYAGRTDRLPWHRADVDAPREIEVDLVRFDRDQTERLRTQARAAGTAVHGLLVAAALGAVVAQAPGVERLSVATAVDMKGPNGLAPDAPIGMAAGIISASFDVTVPTVELARAITADTRRRVERGEGDLVYALSGAERLVVGEQSDAAVARWTADAPPVLLVSNVGVVPEPVPDVVRRLLPNLAPTPNQVLFIAATTLRGRLELVISYDRNRLDVAPEVLTAAVREQVLHALDADQPAPEEAVAR